MDLPKDVIIAVNILTNLDSLGIIQTIIAKMGVYKFVFYVLYFGVIA